MLTVAAFRALLSRIPGIAWVALVVITFIAAGLWGAFHMGEQKATRRIALHAVNDSVKHATAAVDTATHRTDLAVGEGASAGRVADAALRRREELRARLTIVDSATAMIGDVVATPAQLIQLVQVDDSTIAALRTKQIRDSVSIAMFQAERTARIARDTLVAHREALETAPADGLHVVPVALGAGGGAAIGATVGGPPGALVGAALGSLVGWLVGR